MSDSSFIPDDKLPRYTPDRLRTIRRRELGLTQEELAEGASCDTKTVQRYESGGSPIPPEFIRTVERLRVEDRERRAREVGADEIDFSSVSTPGLKLIELIPNVHVRELLGKLARIFVAVPKEWLAPSEKGTAVVSTVVASRMTKAGDPPHRPDDPPPGFVVLSYPEGKTGPRVLIEEMGQCPPEGQPPTSRVGAPARRPRGSGTSSASAGQASLNARGRVAIGFALAASFACFNFATGCLSSHRTRTERDPTAVPGELYTDNATDGDKDMGTGRDRSIPMPNEPYKWQKRGPCGQGEIEKIGGCWIHSDSLLPPCSDAAVESEGSCWVPVPAKPKKPNTVAPNK